MERVRKEKMLYDKFTPLSKEDKALFAPYMQMSAFGDTCFSLMYAWDEELEYAYRRFGNQLIVLEKDKEKNIFCMILQKDHTQLYETMDHVIRIFKDAGMKLVFKYVDEMQIEQYKEVLERLKKSYTISSVDDDDDYLYDVKEFLALEGKVNKGKRGKINHLARNIPNIELQVYDEVTLEIIAECMDIFEQWCQRHECANCYYGCEKKACERFFDVFEKQWNKVGIVYCGGRPLSFAIGEQIDEETFSIFFQKNAKKTRGLMYWLDREMAKVFQDVKYVNLGEDMGIAGIREEKENLHPTKHKKKYMIEVIGTEEGLCEINLNG